MGVLAVSMLAIGSLGSIAMQTYAQTSPPTATISTGSTVRVDQTVDQKDSTGADIETQDDVLTSVTSTGSTVKSEKGETETNDKQDSQENEAD